MEIKLYSRADKKIVLEHDMESCTTNSTKNLFWLLKLTHSNVCEKEFLCYLELGYTEIEL